MEPPKNPERFKSLIKAHMLTRKVEGAVRKAGSPTSLKSRGEEPLSQLHKNRVVNFLVLLSFLFFRPTNEKDQAKESSNSKNKAGLAKTREPSLNRSGNVEPEARQTRKTSQKKKEQGQQQTSAPVFGPQKEAMVFTA